MRVQNPNQIPTPVGLSPGYIINFSMISGMLFDTSIYSSNMYPGCNIYTRYNTICYASIFFLHWSLGQEEKMGRKGEKRRWAGGGRQRANGDDEEGFLFISLRPLPAKRTREIRARCSFMFRVGPVATHCASSPRQLLRKWATASYCIADSYGRPSVCALL